MGWAWGCRMWDQVWDGAEGARKREASARAFSSGPLCICPPVTLGIAPPKETLLAACTLPSFNTRETPAGKGVSTHRGRLDLHQASRWPGCLWMQQTPLVPKCLSWPVCRTGCELRLLSSQDERRTVHTRSPEAPQGALPTLDPGGVLLTQCPAPLRHESQPPRSLWPTVPALSSQCTEMGPRPHTAPTHPLAPCGHGVGAQQTFESEIAGMRQRP